MSSNWIYTTSGAATAKAGAHANATIVADAIKLEAWSKQAQGEIDVATETTWTTSFSSLSTGVVDILDSIASSKIAKNIISYNNTGYLPGEAQFMLNVQDDIVREGLGDLKKLQNKELETP